MVNVLKLGIAAIAMLILSVSYLLQRLEAYGGLAIITTNWEESLDQAFKRRFRHIVKFPMPDKETRKLLWQRIFPKATPTHQLNFTELAKMHISGGNIRSIALNACFLAAKTRQPVTMKQVAIAARQEYLKLDLGNMDTLTQSWLQEAAMNNRTLVSPRLGKMQTPNTVYR